MEELQLPKSLLPSDGRFGCGPTKIPPSHLQQVAASPLMGTSHRQQPVRALVGSIQERFRDYFGLPKEYAVVLGNGGASTFWAVATTSLVRRRSAHAVFGAFGQKFAAHTTAAPHLREPVVYEAAPGSLAMVRPNAEVDAYAWVHHETSTGVVSPLQVPTAGGLRLVDGTSIAGALPLTTLPDAYYFSPQKVFASDGGLWFAFLSPAAVDRAQELASDQRRWMPDVLNLALAVEKSAAQQTVNTPALATLILLSEELDALIDAGGPQKVAAACARKAQLIYEWAESSDFATPFVKVHALRSPVVATIDIEGLDAKAISSVCRRAGIVDIDSYRALGRNQLRIGTYPAVSEADVCALLECLDRIGARL